MVNGRDKGTQPEGSTTTTAAENTSVDMREMKNRLDKAKRMPAENKDFPFQILPFNYGSLDCVDMRELGPKERSAATVIGQSAFSAAIGGLERNEIPLCQSHVQLERHGYQAALQTAFNDHASANAGNPNPPGFDFAQHRADWNPALASWECDPDGFSIAFRIKDPATGTVFGYVSLYNATSTIQAGVIKITCQCLPLIESTEADRSDPRWYIDTVGLLFEFLLSNDLPSLGLSIRVVQINFSTDHPDHLWNPPGATEVGQALESVATVVMNPGPPPYLVSLTRL